MFEPFAQLTVQAEQVVGFDALSVGWVGDQQSWQGSFRDLLKGLGLEGNVF